MDYGIFLNPIAEVLVSAAATAVVAGIGYGIKYANSHWKLLQSKQAQAIEADARGVLDTVTTNVAQELVADIHSGNLSLTDKAGLQAAANTLIATVKTQISNQVATLKTDDGTIGSMLLQKAVLGASASPVLAAAITSATPTVVPIVTAAAAKEIKNVVTDIAKGKTST